ncbi:MAG: hypothetical protein EPN45_21710 [Rhizobiaceae bacterium]|nr:MAG: hypothetical protein EPN45_21710 [Rhizobiaceae bacterium]
MGFLIKTAFWFGLVLLVIPFGTGGDKDRLVNPVEAFQAAREAAGDIAGMCERKPDVCVVGKSALYTIGVHAREGAKVAYQMLDARFGKDNAGKEGEESAAADSSLDTSIKTGTIVKAD